ncbi:hypothetical protein ACHAWF_002646 [Thalassiosira exigua]
MKRAKIRLLFLLPPIVISLIFAIVPLFYNMYNVTMVFCYISPYPRHADCDHSVSCTRGDKARPVQTALSMSMLVHSVYSQERKGDKYLSEGQSRRRQHTRKTAWQGARYIGAFTLANFALYTFMVWQIGVLAPCSRMSKPSEPAFFVLWYFLVLLNPLCGLFNAMVYFWSRYGSYKEQHPKASMTDCICHVLKIGVPRCPGCCIKLCTNHRSGAHTAESVLVSPLITEESDAL